jgi:hypothetical protein
MDRTNEIEFTRKWGVDSLTTADEQILEGNVRYAPSSGVVLGGAYGKIDRGDDLRSIRAQWDLSLQKEGLPVTAYTIERIRAVQQRADNVSTWLRQRGNISYTLWKATPGFVYEGEHRDITSLDGTIYRPGSFSYDQYGPRLTIKDLGPVAFSAEFLWRKDNVATTGVMANESNSFTQAYSGRLSETGNFTTALDVTLREKRYSPEYKSLGNEDMQTVLVRSQSRYFPLNRGVDADLYYEVATQRSSKLERVFVRVAPGTGNYKYLGDLNNNGIADDNEFELTRFDGDYVAITVPSEGWFPIIDLKTSFRLRVTPSRFLKHGEGFLGDALSALSTETYARFEEKSSEHDLRQIYLLNFNRFLQDSTTLAGSQLLTQDVLLFDGKPLFSSRFRYSQRRGLINFAGGIERSFVRERSIRLRWQLVPEISNQLDYVNKTDRISSDQTSNRVHDILSNSVTFDVSYRPEQNVELGMKFDLAKSTDRFQIPALEASMNAQSVRLVYALQGAGQGRAELSREEVRLGTTSETYPYELTGGRVAGKTWLWRIGFDYRVTQFVQATVNYDGRSEGGSIPVHTASAEARVFF